MGCSPWLPADGHAQGADTEPVPVAQCHIPVSNWGRAGGPCPRIRPPPVQLWSRPRTAAPPAFPQEISTAAHRGDFGGCCNRHTDTCTLLRAQEQLYKPQALLLCLEPVFPLKSIAQRTRERAGSPALPIVTRLTQPLQLQLFSLGTKQRCLQRDRALLPPTSLGELRFLLVPGKKRHRSQAFTPQTSK